VSRNSGVRWSDLVAWAAANMPNDDSSAVVERPSLPLSAGDEPIVAQRLWVVELINGVPRLGSVAKPTAWAPREAFTASCWRSETLSDVPYEHESPWPGAGCNCGIWGLRERDPALLAMWATAVFSPIVGPLHVAWALGTVKLWGRVVECARGWRAQYAYPRTLELIDPIVAAALVHDHVQAFPATLDELNAMAAELARDYLVPVTLMRPLPNPPPTVIYCAQQRTARQRRYAMPFWRRSRNTR
jgi:hypothetical protein